jgi:hypothetical protein
MKTTHIIVIVAIITSALLTSVWAQDAELDNLASLGPGVHDIKKDNGQLRSLKVVGSARIPSSLGAAKGLEIARDRAQLSAQQQFVEWIKANVTAIKSSDSETIISLESGAEGATESGKSVETDKNSVISQAQGLVRGLTLIGKKQDGDNQTLTLVYGWSSVNTDLSRQAQSDNERRPGSASASPGGTAVERGSVGNEATKSSAFGDY